MKATFLGGHMHGKVLTLPELPARLEQTNSDGMLDIYVRESVQSSGRKVLVDHHAYYALLGLEQAEVSRLRMDVGIPEDLDV